jgi:hypothetical protein
MNRFKQNDYPGKVTSWLLPLVMLLAGLYFFPFKFFEHDFSKIPGDLGDARFNNYVLEHGYKYFTGKADNFWDAPFMYPYKNVIALSDNLLGALPLYSFFRTLNLDRESAFQFWILTVFSLNFICCFYALKKWSGNVILSSVGAYIFAFSIYNIGQLGHAQVFPRFIVPLVFYWFWKFLSARNTKYFFFSILGMVYQFYCGVYLGFLLAYAIMFLFISYIIVYRDWDFFYQYKKAKILGMHFAAIVLGGILLAPIVIPYLKVAHTIGTHNFNDVYDSIPRLRSYFFTTQAPVIWRFLYQYSAYSFPNWWNHFLFPGALPWLGILFMPLIFFRRKIEIKKKYFIGFISLGFFLSFIFCLNIQGFTLYKIIFRLPGFSSMRSMDRIINVEIMYFILIFVFVFRELFLTNKIMKWIIMSFPALVIMDNHIEVWDIKRYDKAESQSKIKDIREVIKNQYDKHSLAIAYISIYNAVETLDENKKLVEVNLSVMLATQELDIPCVNAYTGFSPGNYSDFFLHPDIQTLNSWCEFVKTDCKHIQIVNDIGKKEQGRSLIFLQLNDGKFVSVDEGKGDSVVADKDKASTWETFLLFRFDNNKCVIRAHTNKFFNCNHDARGTIIANGEVAGESEIFTLIELPDNFVALKAENGKYLSIDERTRKLFAKSYSIGVQERFHLSIKDK